MNRELVREWRFVSLSMVRRIKAERESRESRIGQYTRLDYKAASEVGSHKHDFFPCSESRSSTVGTLEVTLAPHPRAFVSFHFGISISPGGGLRIRQRLIKGGFNYLFYY